MVVGPRTPQGAAQGAAKCAPSSHKVLSVDKVHHLGISFLGRWLQALRFPLECKRHKRMLPRMLHIVHSSSFPLVLREHSVNTGGFYTDGISPSPNRRRRHDGFRLVFPPLCVSVNTCSSPYKQAVCFSCPTFRQQKPTYGRFA